MTDALQYGSAGQLLIPARGPVGSQDLRTEQQAIKDVNDPTVAAEVASRRQVANPPANSPEFQPWGGQSEHEKVVGTMATGGDPSTALVSDQALEAGNLISGGERPVGADVYVKDFLPGDNPAHKVFNSPQPGQE